MLDACTKHVSQRDILFFISHILSIKAIQIRIWKAFSFMDIIYRLSLENKLRKRLKLKSGHIILNTLYLYVIVKYNTIIYEQFTNKSITFHSFYMPRRGPLKRIYIVYKRV